MKYDQVYGIVEVYMTRKKSVQNLVPPYNCEVLFTVFQSWCITLESLCNTHIATDVTVTVT